ncbi:acetyl-CoA carboxylase biotin carboxyl carrier protein [Candidatus Omnitrophota bacterium]
MHIKEIKEMLKLMDDNDLMELEIEKDGLRIKLKKTTQHATQPAQLVIEKEVSREKPSLAQQEASKPSGARTVEIKAPMVGTFYRSPNPDSSAYTDIGQQIEPGQIICIIEAMKLMNEIKSEIKGRITEILVENAEPVEFGQPLFLVEPL